MLILIIGKLQKLNNVSYPCGEGDEKVTDEYEKY